MQLHFEDVKPQRGGSLSILKMDQPLFDDFYHHHPELEITWVVESEGQRLIGDSFDTFRAGDVVLIGASVPHLYRNLRRGRARANVIQFNRGLFEPGVLALPEFQRVQRLLDEAARGLAFSEATQAAARRHIAAIVRLEPGPPRLLRLLELLHLFSLDKRRRPIASIAYREPVKPARINRLQRVFRYMEDHWQEPLSLAEAARAASLHPSSLSRFFRQHLGMNFQSYLIELRVSRASHLLLETERTVADIAFACGFRNLSNFNRHFKRLKGESPKEYRLKAAA